MIDLWGSAALRTGGEDLALAFILMGATPVWDDESNRISGVEILPLALLDRPRVDVTLRISGLFRDAFETQLLMFDMAVRSIAARDEPADFNSLAAAARGLEDAALRAATARIFGPAPGAYGAGISLHEDNRRQGGLGRNLSRRRRLCLRAGVGRRSRCAEFRRARGGRRWASFISRTMPRSICWTGRISPPSRAASPPRRRRWARRRRLYHVDSSRADAPRVRLLQEEIARVVRGRAANPAWIAGMMRHDYRGAAEIGRALEGLYAFAVTVPERFDAQFDLLFDATLGTTEVDDFLRSANPEAHRAMVRRFQQALDQGLWRNRRNSVAARLAAP